jgi:hypothetical protein
MQYTKVVLHVIKTTTLTNGSYVLNYHIKVQDSTLRSASNNVSHSLKVFMATS